MNDFVHSLLYLHSVPQSLNPSIPVWRLACSVRPSLRAPSPHPPFEHWDLGTKSNTEVIRYISILTPYFPLPIFVIFFTHTPFPFPPFPPPPFSRLGVYQEPRGDEFRRGLRKGTFLSYCKVHTRVSANPTACVHV